LSIVFYSEIPDFELKNQEEYKDWLKEVCQLEDRQLGEIIYKFSENQKIRELNYNYLKHNWETDIITFDRSFLNRISGDIIIGIEKVKEHAALYEDNNFEHELKRVIVHGILHLIGYKDESAKQKEIIREKENHYLELF
jgi:probable rRNA maturation factor